MTLDCVVLVSLLSCLLFIDWRHSSHSSSYLWKYTQSTKVLFDNGADIVASSDVSIIINYTPIVIVKSNIYF